MVDLTIKKVKTAIISQNWTQRELSEKMGLTVPALAYKLTEPGRFKAMELKYLCDLLQVPFPNRLPDNLTKISDIV
jgi:transcriptional regulator with XRE-family HTH domain